MTLDLVPLGTLRLTIARQTLIPAVHAGQRLIGEAVEGVWVGDRVNASLVGGSASDWVTIHGDGSVTVDARLLFATAEGAHIAMRYRGRAAAAPITGAAIYTTPTFETDDPRYAWLNLVQAVGRGSRDGSRLTYELYELR